LYRVRLGQREGREECVVEIGAYEFMTLLMIIGESALGWAEHSFCCKYRGMVVGEFSNGIYISNLSFDGGVWLRCCAGVCRCACDLFNVVFTWYGTTLLMRRRGLWRSNKGKDNANVPAYYMFTK
jgi:hypothetical protein